MVEADVLEGIDHNENGDIQLPQSSDTPPRSRSSSETLQKPLTGVQWSRNGARGSIMSARFSESSNDSFIFGERYGEVDIIDAQADNGVEVRFRIRLADLQPAHWPENDEDDPELVLLEYQREHNVERMLSESGNSPPEMEFSYNYGSFTLGVGRDDDSDVSTEVYENDREEQYSDAEFVLRGERDSDTEVEWSDNEGEEVKSEASDEEVKTEEVEFQEHEISIANDKTGSGSPQLSCSKQDDYSLSDSEVMILKSNRGLLAGLEEWEYLRMNADSDAETTVLLSERNSDTEVEWSDDEEVKQNSEKTEEVEFQEHEISNENDKKGSGSPQPSCSKQDDYSDSELMIPQRNRELLAALEEWEYLRMNADSDEETVLLSERNSDTEVEWSDDKREEVKSEASDEEVKQNSVKTEEVEFQEHEISIENDKKGSGSPQPSCGKQDDYSYLDSELMIIQRNRELLAALEEWEYAKTVLRSERNSDTEVEWSDDKGEEVKSEASDEEVKQNSVKSEEVEIQEHEISNENDKKDSGSPQPSCGKQDDYSLSDSEVMILKRNRELLTALEEWEYLRMNADSDEETVLLSERNSDTEVEWSDDKREEVKLEASDEEVKQNSVKTEEVEIQEHEISNENDKKGSGSPQPSCGKQDGYSFSDSELMIIQRNRELLAALEEWEYAKTVLRSERDSDTEVEWLDDEGEDAKSEASSEKTEEEEESNKEVEFQELEISNADSPQLLCSKQADYALSDTQLIRKKNRELIMAALEESKDPKMEAELGRTKETFLFSCAEPSKKKTGSKRKREDETVRFNVKIPLERRCSKRLRKETPDYNENSLDSVKGNLPATDKILSDDELDNVIYEPKPRQSKAHSTGNKYVIRVEDVTQEMLDNIFKNSGKKQYSARGTTCHQCRQKTIDQKTSCRNPECTGFRGVFCGVCLKTRYGQNCADALLDPNWFCPPCRGCCNCSVCRTKEGKRPTGILYPIAASAGYQSVDHFLVGLKGKGNKPEDDELEKDALNNAAEAFLGFSDEGHKAHFQGCTVKFIDCSVCYIKERNNPENLLGFDDDGAAIMGGNKVEHNKLVSTQRLI